MGYLSAVLQSGELHRVYLIESKILIIGNRIYAQFGGKELFDSCIYLIEYMLIIYFSHFFCTRIVILLTSVRGKRTEVKIRRPG